MKANSTQITKACILCALLAPATSSISYGNINFAFDTDGMGGITTGGFSGTGSPGNNIVTGSGGMDLITGVSTGDVLTMDITGGGAGSALLPGMTMDTTFSLGGGTADLEFTQVGGSDWKGFSLQNLQGVSCLDFTSVFSAPINARSNPTFISGLPWGFSTGLLDPGTGFMNGDFDVTYTIGGLVYSSNPGTAPFAPGGGPGYTPFSSAQWDNSATPNTLAFTSSNGFAGIGGGNNVNNLLVRGFDDENVALDTPDTKQYYADTFSISIKPKGGGTFASDADFVFSFDGSRDLAVVIPEPTRALLMALGLGILGLRRRR